MSRISRIEHRLNVWTVRVIRRTFPDLLPWIERKYAESNVELVRLGEDPSPPLKKWPGEEGSQK